MTYSPEDDAAYRPPKLRETQAVVALRARQDFRAAVLAGVVAMFIGAVVWATFVYFSHLKAGAVSLVVGLIIGFSVRFAGQGVDQSFGVLGATCAAFSWVLGACLCDVAFYAHQFGLTIGAAFGQLGPVGVFTLAPRFFTIRDPIFFVIAVFEGYKFSFRYKI